MNKILPILLILFVTACGSEGADTPEQAAARFIEALQSGSADRVYDAVVRSEVENFRKVDERLDYNRWDDCPIEDFEIKGVVLDGNRARVTVRITREVNGVEEHSEELVVCVREQQRWKVTMSASSKVFLPSGKKPD